MGPLIITLGFPGPASGYVGAIPKLEGVAKYPPSTVYRLPSTSRESAVVNVKEYPKFIVNTLESVWMHVGLVPRLVIESEVKKLLQELPPTTTSCLVKVTTAES